MLAIALLLITLNVDVQAQKIIKAELVFKGIKKISGNWQLWFTDRKNKPYLFNPQRSNTAPYIFYHTEGDGSLKENEKVKNNWFRISYTNLLHDKTVSKIITHVEASITK